MKGDGIEAEVFIHPTAVVDPGAVIGAGTKVWHFCHVTAGARVGAGCVLGQNVFVGGAAVIGDGCRIQNNVSLYDEVHFEDQVFIGPSAVFTNVSSPRAFISRKGEFSPTWIGRGATVGANATVLCGRRLGAYCLVAAGAVVTRDVLPHALVVGVPARRKGWVCRCGEKLPRSGSPRDELGCLGCGARFRLMQAGAAERGQTENSETIVLLSD